MINFECTKFLASLPDINGIHDRIETVDFAPNRFGSIDDVIRIAKSFNKLGCSTRFGYLNRDYNKKTIREMINYPGHCNPDTLIIRSDIGTYGLDRRVLLKIIDLHPDGFIERQVSEYVVDYYLWWD